MNSPVVVSISHRLGKEEAIRRIRGGFNTLRGHLAALISIEHEKWTVSFQVRRLWQSAAGTITVVDQSVHIEITLPWILAKVAERLLPAIRRETTLLLEQR